MTTLHTFPFPWLHSHFDGGGVNPLSPSVALHGPSSCRKLASPCGLYPIVFAQSIMGHDKGLEQISNDVFLELQVPGFRDANLHLQCTRSRSSKSFLPSAVPSLALYSCNCRRQASSDQKYVQGCRAQGEQLGISEQSHYSTCAEPTADGAA